MGDSLIRHDCEDTFAGILGCLYSQVNAGVYYERSLFLIVSVMVQLRR
jgi:hypothetical protein